jgi:hypothetical protein
MIEVCNGQAEKKNRGIIFSLHATPAEANKNVVTSHTKRSMMLRMQKNSNSVRPGFVVFLCNGQDNVGKRHF